MALTAWPDPSANSYVTQAAATTYFGDAIHAAEWTAADSATKDAGLVTATRIIDRQTWQGSMTVSTQPLQWPRTGVVDQYGDEVDDATIPWQITEATYELALALIIDDSIQGQAQTGSGNFKRLKAGSAEVEYFRPGTPTRFPTIVQELLAPFLAGSASQLVGVAYGTDVESSFDDEDILDLNEGYA